MKSFLLLIILLFGHGFSLETKIFDLYDEPIDVVIPAVEKDRDSLELCIQAIREYGVNIRRVICVSKNHLTDKAEWFNEDDYPFSFEDVKAALGKNNPTLIQQLEKSRKTGWYFQQLLKLYAVFVIPDISSNILVLDSDTIFLKEVSFINQGGGGLYNYGNECHKPYFYHADKLIPGLSRVYWRTSGVTHHMIFQQNVLEELFKDVEDYHNDAFWKVFCDQVSGKYLVSEGASEYEIYFNYLFSSSDQFTLRPLKWANIKSLDKIGYYREKGFDYVSCHDYSTRIDIKSNNGFFDLLYNYFF